MIPDDGQTRVGVIAVDYAKNTDATTMVVVRFEEVFSLLRARVLEVIDPLERAFRETAEMIRDLARGLAYHQRRRRSRSSFVFGTYEVTLPRDNVPTPRPATAPRPVVLVPPRFAREPRRTTASGWHAPRPRR